MNALKKSAGFLSVATVLTMSTSIASAHPGHLIHDPSDTTMLLLGFLHPLTGVDHLLAMVAVGIWSSMMLRTVRQAILTPLLFLVVLLAGAVSGIAGMRLPGIEPVIMASLLVLGLLLASRATVRDWVSISLVSFFALFHGLAHGMELPPGGLAAAYVAGFMAASLVLLLVGLFAGFQLKRSNRWVARTLGAGLATYGAILFFSA